MGREMSSKPWGVPSSLGRSRRYFPLSACSRSLLALLDSEALGSTEGDTAWDTGASRCQTWFLFYAWVSR